MLERDVWNSAIPAPDGAAEGAARARWDTLAKPLGSLGLLEEAVTRVCAAQGTPSPELRPRTVLVFCADNGVTEAGVAGTPPSITAVMAGIIRDKRSAVGLMADCAGAEVLAVDMGMFTRVPGLTDRRIAPGTKNFVREPAMTREQAVRALEAGRALALERAKRGDRLLLTGEMGIGNTTTATAVAAALLAREPEALVGPGVGLDEAGLARKRAAVRRGLALHRPDPSDPLDVLSKVGGFDIAAMAGAFIGGAESRVPVVADGFISGVAALVAARLCPAARPYMLASHLSMEPAAGPVLFELGLRPILHAGMRLGEGTGAVALLPLLDMAKAVFDGLLTYRDIGMEGGTPCNT